MATRTRIAKMDENEAIKTTLNLKQFKTATAPAETKRAALGELGNRDATKKDVLDKNGKLLGGFKHVKAKVNTHWKKGSDKIEAPAEVVAHPLKKTATYKSVDIPTNNILVERKLAGRNVIRTNSLKDNVVTVKASSITVFKREESQLTRRSLSKIRAAFKKEQKLSNDLCNKTDDEKISSTEDLADTTAKATIESHSSKLLCHIEDIDCDDHFNPALLSEYVNDIYKYLYEMEANFPIKENHLESQKEISPKMRGVLIDWLNEVHHQFHLTLETFHMTVSIIDRYLQEVTQLSRKYLQLVGVTALFIASKYEDLYPAEIGDFVYIADNTYTKKQILQMEKQIIRKLEFQLGKPLPIHFLRRYSKAAKADDVHHLLAKYIIELTSIDYSLSHLPPSKIAGASLMLSLIVLSKTPNMWFDSVWTPTLEHYSKYSSDDLRPIVKTLASIVKNASSNKLKAIYTKYSSTKFDAISTKPDLYHDILDKIIRDA